MSAWIPQLKFFQRTRKSVDENFSFDGIFFQKPITLSSELRLINGLDHRDRANEYLDSRVENLSTQKKIYQQKFFLLTKLFSKFYNFIIQTPIDERIGPSQLWK